MRGCEAERSIDEFFLVETYKMEGGECCGIVGARKVTTVVEPKMHLLP